MVRRLPATAPGPPRATLLCAGDLSGVHDACVGAYIMYGAWPISRFLALTLVREQDIGIAKHPQGYSGLRDGRPMLSDRTGVDSPTKPAPEAISHGSRGLVHRFEVADCQDLNCKVQKSWRLPTRKEYGDTVRARTRA